MYYVYLHRKLNGEVFYVGKGTRKRAFSRHNRSCHWLSVANKYGYTVEIVLDGLQEWYAFELELELITFYGLKSEGGMLVNVVRGGCGNGGYIFTEADKLLISQKNSGNGNGRSDKNIYHFVRLADNETFIGTRQAFTSKYNIRISDLFKSDALTVFGWCLAKNLQRIGKPKYDAKIYTFIHKDGNTLTVTRREFKRITNIDCKPLFRELPAKSVKGWSLT